MILVSHQDYKNKSKDDILDELEDTLNELERAKQEKKALEKELRNWELETVIVFAETPY